MQTRQHIGLRCEEVGLTSANGKKSRKAKQNLNRDVTQNLLRFLPKQDFYSGFCRPSYLKKNLNASRLFEHPTHGEKLQNIFMYFQHAHFIPIVGVGKERRTLIGP